MNPEELMLGDWVYIPKLRYDLGDGDCFNGYTRITKLERDEVWTEDFTELSYDEIFPIPLTAKLLTAIGFPVELDYNPPSNLEPQVVNSVYVGLNPAKISIVSVLLRDKNAQYCTSKNSVSFYIPIFGPFVHELQHILKTCKVEKEIILPYEILD